MAVLRRGWGLCCQLSQLLVLESLCESGSEAPENLSGSFSLGWGWVEGFTAFRVGALPGMQGPPPPSSRTDALAALIYTNSTRNFLLLTGVRLGDLNTTPLLLEQPTPHREAALREGPGKEAQGFLLLSWCQASSHWGKPV